MLVKFFTILGLLSTLASIVYCACPHEPEADFKRWSAVTTWASGQLPGDDAEIIITENILLDTVTSRLDYIVIKDGGRLVFDPAATKAKLIAKNVTVDIDGSLEIGSFDCKFDGDAEVLLIGSYDADMSLDPDFGHKAIGVKAGGTLEIHGKEKKSWTKLSATLNHHAKIFTTLNNQPNFVGLTMYEFDRSTGAILNEFEGLRRHKSLINAIGSLQTSSVIILTNRGPSWNGSPTPVFKDLAKTINILQGQDALGSAGSIPLDSWTDVNDPWVLMVDRNGANSQLKFEINNIEDETVELETQLVKMTVNGILYRAKSYVNTVERKLSTISLSTMMESSWNEYNLNVIDNVDSWIPGDKIVIASTDFDMNQAEELEVVATNGNSITAKGELEYDHYGEIYETVDMRAEVGLLTRSVKIHGEMGTSCVNDHLDICDTHSFDNYGGHTKALKGFKAYNIEGAELTNMGQMTQLGSYPIHFHMCNETMRDNKPPMIANNSIHHCFSRCVTVHGSHNVHVMDNVGYDTYGHCYFLEDGGERDSVFIGNLGLTTRRGFLTPSDNQPTTFWLTSPLTTVVGNSAAGSDTRGVGFWFLFPDAPVGPSTDLGFFKRLEAKRTPITLFDQNVAHSNGRIGLGVFRRLTILHGITGCSTYDPREYPHNGKADRTPVFLSNFTGFKNRETNVHMRSSTAQLSGFKLSDSLLGIKFVRNMLSGYQKLSNSVIIGDSPNLGVGQEITVSIDGKNMPQFVNRSLADPRHPHEYKVGVYFNVEGAHHLENVKFVNFDTNSLRSACAIEFKDDYRLGMGVTSSVSGIDTSGMTGNVICHKNQIDGIDESSMMLRDLDGSLTGTAGQSVVSDDSFLHGDMNCAPNSNWNMSVCQGKFARFYVFPKFEVGGSTFVTVASGENSSASKSRVGYTVNADSKFTMNWNVTIPESYTIRATGLDQSFGFTLGICMPMDSVNLDVNEFVDMNGDWRDKSEIMLATSLSDLDADTAGKNIYFDTTKGVLYVKFIEKNARTAADLADCVGSLNLDTCPHIRIKLKGKNVDLENGNCSGR